MPWTSRAWIFCRRNASIRHWVWSTLRSWAVILSYTRSSVQYLIIGPRSLYRSLQVQLRTEVFEQRLFSFRTTSFSEHWVKILRGPYSRAATRADIYYGLPTSSRTCFCRHTRRSFHESGCPFGSITIAVSYLGIVLFKLLCSRKLWHLSRSVFSE